MTQLTLPRRKFLSGGLALLAAPAIVRASSLMQIKPERESAIPFITPEPINEHLLYLVANPPLGIRHFENQFIGFVKGAGHVTWVNPDTFEIVIPERQPGA